MPTQKLCPVLSAKQIYPGAFAMEVDAGEIARKALPGQFVHVRCGDRLLLRRPISVCDVNGDCMKLVFEVRGEGTKWLSQRRAGDTLDLLGPLGHGFDVSGKKVILAGGGIGVPPLLYAARRCAGEVYVVLGFRSRERAMLLEDFQMLNNVKSLTLASDDGTLGFHGTLKTPLEQIMDRESDFTDVLSCGPKPMLWAVSQVAWEHQVPCQVSMEERMGCGMGACLVCACALADGSMRRVCKDGPVFHAEEVDWSE